ncbi:MAG: hypothetical protein IKC13_06735 [Elusimicrobiaceae bacterium]|nr:hypothetical protein [Elusimicrobiaceae bacterium]
MKMLRTILNSRWGKTSVSTLRVVGAAAALGVAGIAAWQITGSPEEISPEMAFSSSDADVVYVAGNAGRGAYSGVSYGEGGEVQSTIRARLSHSQRMMNAEFEKSQLAQSELDAAEGKIQAYKMDGASGGLGVQGASATSMGDFGNTGSSAEIQAQMAGFQAKLAEAQQTAQAAAAAGARAGAEGANGDATSAAVAAMQKAQGGKWAMNEGIVRSGGTNLNTLEFGGTNINTKEGHSVSHAEKMRVGGVSQIDERNPLYAGGRDGVFGNGKMKVDTLQAYAKMSADTTRMGDKATDVFMAGTIQKKAASINGTRATTGGNSSSMDFGENNSIPADAFDAAIDKTEEFEADQQALRDALKTFVNKCGWSSLIPGLNYVGYLTMLKQRNDLYKQVEQFQEKWGYNTPKEKAYYAQYVGQTMNVQEDHNFGTDIRDMAYNAYRAIGGSGQPWYVYKRMKKQLWQENEEEEKKNQGGSSSNREPQNIHGGSRHKGDLNV